MKSVGLKREKPPEGGFSVTLFRMRPQRTEATPPL